MTLFEQLKMEMAIAETEGNKFYNDKNRSAASRLKSALRNMKDIIDPLRDEVSRLKNTI